MSLSYAESPTSTDKNTYVGGGGIQNFPDDECFGQDCMEMIGMGSFARVYIYLDENETCRALKTSEISESKGIMNLREIDFLSKSNHKNIVSSFGVKTILEDCDEIISFSISIELATCDLENFMKYIDHTYEVKSVILNDILMGLDYVHKSGYVHADIKPHNILVFREEFNGDIVAKLCDFGSCVYLGGNDSVSCRKHLTTFIFRAPELMDDEMSISHYRSKIHYLDFPSDYVSSPSASIEVPTKTILSDGCREPVLEYIYTTKTDIWSFGITAFYLVTEVGFNDSFYNRSKIEINKNQQMEYVRKCIDMKNYPEDIRKLYLDVIDKALEIDPSLRAECPELISMLGGNQQTANADGNCKEQIQFKETSQNIVFYYGFDFMLRTGLQLDIDVETFFLACDLYQRSIHMLELSSGYNINEASESYDWRNVSCMSLVCLWISMKMIQDIYLTTDEIVVLGGNRFDIYLVLSMEQNIVEFGNGIIYRDNLYRSGNELLKSFEHLYNVFTYHKIDINSSPSFSRGFSPMPSKLSELYPRTEYFHNIKNFGIPYLFERDRSNSFGVITSRDNILVF